MDQHEHHRHHADLAVELEHDVGPEAGSDDAEAPRDHELQREEAHADEPERHAQLDEERPGLGDRTDPGEHQRPNREHAERRNPAEPTRKAELHVAAGVPHRSRYQSEPSAVVRGVGTERPGYPCRCDPC